MTNEQELRDEVAIAEAGSALRERAPGHTGTSWRGARVRASVERMEGAWQWGPARSVGRGPRRSPGSAMGPYRTIATTSRAS
jgi:hypothetical protein